MKLIISIKEMQGISNGLRMECKTISFVPTMGYLHDAHIKLFEEGRKRGDCLVVSLFVNPTQFGQGEDYTTYPRDIEKDKKLAEEAGVDILFVPEVSDMYPSEYQTYVAVERVTKNLCGAVRPGHFRGVATVVTKLFNIVKPHIALFGEKDYQQLITIKRLVEDLNFDMEIVGIPTAREEDGLALSSRNTYLAPEEREIAPLLFKALKEGERLYLSGERRAERIINTVRDGLMKEPKIAVEYIKVCHPESLEDISTVDKRGLLALAARIGKARLIDNIVLKK